MVSSILTASIGGIFGNLTTDSEGDTLVEVKRTDVEGELKVKTTEVEGALKVQRLSAEAERDRLEIQQKFEIVVQATKGLPPDVAANNLLFFVKAGILPDEGA